jgi:hypothetical protein
MIPVTQTKFFLRNSKGEVIQRGNCYAACIASLLEISITEVPNVEVFFHLDGLFWSDVMDKFLESKGWELFNNHKFARMHPDDNRVTFIMPKGDVDAMQLKDRYYLVSGKSARDVNHIVIYKNGYLAHDPHPSREGLITMDNFQVLEPFMNQQSNKK